MLEDDSVNPATDDLPRPPRGRRSATRPAGPPPEAPEMPEASVPAEPAPAAEPAPEPAEDSAPEPAASPRSRSRSARARKTPTAEPAAEADAPAAEEPAAQDEAAEPAAAPASKAKTRTTTSRRRPARTKPTISEAETSPEIEAALSAAEAAAPKRTRRASRSTAAELIGDQVPTDANGEVDTKQVLASLAAAIAGHGETVAALEKGSAPAAIGAGASHAALAAAPADADEDTEESEETDEEAAEATDEQATDPEAAEAEQGESEDADEEAGEQTSSSQRRRRRRGGRRRRRGSGSSADDQGDEQSGDESSEDADEHDESEDGESDEAGAEEATAAIGSSASSRRRRRRRRRGDDSSSDDEAGDVVVRVREPRRSANDEISGIEGSTRLEAKKQRRREGRAAGRHRAPILTEAEFLARRESVDRVMLVRQREDYTQLAVLEDNILVEHYVDRSSSTSLIGNIYLGRVQNVLPSMEAVFIDIGRGRNAVLYAGEVDWNSFDVAPESRKVEQVFKSGQSVLVQVSKDPVGAKGARLTGHVSIPGRYVVYSPGGHLSGISRKLPDAERQRLKQVLDAVVAEESSVIVRTAAEGASAEELVADVERLQSAWQKIEKKSKQGSAPQQLYAEPDLTLRIIRDTFTEDFKQLVVAGNGGPEDAYAAISEYLDQVAPHLADRLVQWDEADGDPFAKFRIDEQISKALERKVFLPSGGSLVIDRTEAMTVIDVNTGKFTGTGGNLEETVTRNNLEAAEEIVRQLRLRDLGGIIVIDFIDMVLPSNRELLLRRLVECLGRDRTRHQVSEVTSLGLVQMTRKRIGTGLAEAFTDSCEHCGGRGYVRHDDPVDSQAPADGGERRSGGRSSNGGNQGGQTSQRSRSRGGSRARATKADEAPKANQVQPSEAAKQAAAKLAAASRHAAEQRPATEEHTDSSEQVVVDVAPTEQVTTVDLPESVPSPTEPEAAEQTDTE